MKIEIEALEHGVTSVYKSGKLSRNTYIETYRNWNIRIRSGHHRIIVTYIHMNMVIDVYEYGRGGKYVYMFRYLYS